MSNIGARIIYNKLDGNVIMVQGEATGADPISARPKIELGYVDLPYGYNEDNFQKAVSYHIEEEKVVIDQYCPLTEEEKLLREKIELENQLLLQADNNLNGGIL